MTPEQLQQLEARLARWREAHPDLPSQRDAYRRRALDFTLSSMALAGEPVDRAHLQALLKPQPSNPSQGRP